MKFAPIKLDSVYNFAMYKITFRQSDQYVANCYISLFGLGYRKKTILPRYCDEVKFFREVGADAVMR